MQHSNILNSQKSLKYLIVYQSFGEIMRVAAAVFLLNVGLILCVEIPVGYNRTSSFTDPTERNANAGCSIKLKPTDCDEGGFCGYQVNLPPLTLKLPKETKLLEKTVKVVKSLTATVNKMKKRWLEGHQKKPTNHDQAIANIKFRKDDKKIMALEKKVKALTTSLQYARNQINWLQSRLEEMNADTVLHYIKKELSSINNTVNTLNNKCYTTCAAEGPPAAIQAMPQDCSDLYNRGIQKSGIYELAYCPNNTFPVYCEMESLKGGWTVLQSRKDGSVDFNRTWADYKNGFGNLSTEFWLGNDKIHFLTKSRKMILRIEIEDWEGVRQYAEYNQFSVADEKHQYRLTIAGYSGTAGDAMHYSKNYNHDQKYFTTKDKDNDMYTSGNCGAYYSSGWWFDACMSANLNGKYYKKIYKGVRNGIFWGTWYKIQSETLNGYRHPLKTVRMLIRPKEIVP
ncbi:fibrinogen-like 2a [Pristis pectinata]|uniref:fibrinogen-like 2a n=1 Tax=Pristis pectinata TaxID=685728 RepID=UPI00223D2570|nr:fibrinogen-like 2a [Pristis pectinata]